MARRKISALPQLQSWEDVDAALLEIGQAEDGITKLELAMNEAITAAKKTAADGAAPLEQAIKVKTQQVKAYVDAHADELEGKTKKLNHGATGYRLSTKCVIPKGQSEAVVAQLKALGLKDCIKSSESVIKDKLKQQPEDIVVKVGARIEKGDEFWLEAHHEQLQPAAE